MEQESLVKWEVTDGRGRSIKGLEQVTVEDQIGNDRAMGDELINPNWETEIESTEGRLRYLKDQVSLSTLHISFYETIEINEPSFEFLSKVGDGFSNGFKGLLWFFIGLVMFGHFCCLLVYLLG